LGSGIRPHFFIGGGEPQQSTEHNQEFHTIYTTQNAMLDKHQIARLHAEMNSIAKTTATSSIRSVVVEKEKQANPEQFRNPTKPNDKASNA